MDYKKKENTPKKDKQTNKKSLFEISFSVLLKLTYLHLMFLKKALL